MPVADVMVSDAVGTFAVELCAGIDGPAGGALAGRLISLAKFAASEGFSGMLGAGDAGLLCCIKVFRSTALTMFWTMF